MTRTSKDKQYENRTCPDFDTEDYLRMSTDASSSNRTSFGGDPLCDSRAFSIMIQEDEEVSVPIDASGIKKSQEVANPLNQNGTSLSNRELDQSRPTNISSTIYNGALGSPHANPTAYNNQCNDSDGATFCDCQQSRDKLKQCMYQGRPVEPLAFTLETKPVDTQEQCSLFSIIPIEIRDLIYEYALTDCTSNPFESEYRFSRIGRQKRARDKPWPLSDIAFALLQSCKRIYLEAYQIPCLVNPHIVYDLHSLTSRPKPADLAPWQFALTASLDISLGQCALEGSHLSVLAQYLKSWRAENRREGAVVVPRFYNKARSRYPDSVIQSSHFGLLPNPSSLSDGDKLSLEHKSTFYSEIMNRTTKEYSSARIMVARPLTHLTLRLSRKDWWTWGDYHASKNLDEHLGLDPACGDGSSDIQKRATTSRMIELAEQRRRGEVPDPQKLSSPPTYDSGTWGTEIGKLPDLKTLTLVLRTLCEKKAQLETVVEWAKTWIFPLLSTNFELVWDERIEDKTYSIRYDKGESEKPDDIQLAPEGNAKLGGFAWVHGLGVEVRVVKFVRRVRKG